MSPVCNTRPFPHVTVSLEKNNITTAITLKSLLENNHSDLITEKDQLPQRNPEAKIERKEVACVSTCCSDERGVKNLLGFFFLEFWRALLFVQQM